MVVQRMAASLPGNKSITISKLRHQHRLLTRYGRELIVGMIQKENQTCRSSSGNEMSMTFTTYSWFYVASSRFQRSPSITSSLSFTFSNNAACESCVSFRFVQFVEVPFHFDDGDVCPLVSKARCRQIKTKSKFQVLK